jgi:hypothetical protein
MMPTNGNNPMNSIIGCMMNSGLMSGMSGGANPGMDSGIGHGMGQGMGPNMTNPNTMNPNMTNPNMMDPSTSGQIDPMAGMSVYKPQGGGTLLADLIKDDHSVGSNGSNRGRNMRLPGYAPRSDRRSDDARSEYTSGYNPAINKYSTRRKNRQKTKYVNRSDSSSACDNDSESNYDSIRELAADVNKSLMALENIEHDKKKKKRQATESELYESDHDKTKKSDTRVMVETVECESEDYLKILTEFLLLLTLYVIMSQSFVVSVASGYIYQLNPTEEGSISMTGIIIYGLILTVMFMVVRKIIFSRM